MLWLNACPPPCGLDGVAVALFWHLHIFIIFICLIPSYFTSCRLQVYFSFLMLKQVFSRSAINVLIMFAVRWLNEPEIIEIKKWEFMRNNKFMSSSASRCRHIKYCCHLSWANQHFKCLRWNLIYHLTFGMEFSARSSSRRLYVGEGNQFAEVFTNSAFRRAQDNNLIRANWPDRENKNACSQPLNVWRTFWEIFSSKIHLDYWHVLMNTRFRKHFSKISVLIYTGS